MKQITLMLFLSSMIAFSAVAQKQNSRSNASLHAANTETAESLKKKSDAVHQCKELNEQLSKIFGTGYSVSDPAVTAQLKRNISDKNASASIRKNSLYAVYGEDYPKHAHLISDAKK